MALGYSERVRSFLVALASFITAIAVAAPGEALDARSFWPNFDAVAKGYHLRGTDGRGFAMWFVAFAGTPNFAMRGDESGCNLDYYTYAHGWLWLLYSLFTCDGMWIEQWYARPPNVVPQDVVPTVGPLAAGLSNKVFLDRNGFPTGIIQTSRWQTYLTTVESEGIRLVSDQIWYDASGLEVGAIRETFLVGEVPLCEDATKTMPGVRRYTMGNHRVVPETTFRDAQLCWTK